MHRDRKLCFLAMLLAVCLCSCGNSGEKPGGQGAAPPGAAQTAEQQTGGTESSKGEAAKPGGYEAPAFPDVTFHEDQAQGTEQAKIDLSAVSQGYVAVKVQSDKRIKMRVSKGDVNYDYDVANDGTPCIFPLQSGDGSYDFIVLEQVVNSSYAELYSASSEVAMTDEFQPFLRSSEYSKYSAESECVKKASELATAEADTLGVVSSVFDYICANVSYDEEKATAVAGASGYMPYPDDTLATGKGICFDYAALSAAMLRSQGIPTKIVFGYVSPGDLYHAWNLFYTAKSGWVSVGYDVEAGNWYRMDTTFSAAGTGNSFVGDGENYMDAKYY